MPEDPTNQLSHTNRVFNDLKCLVTSEKNVHGIIFEPHMYIERDKKRNCKSLCSCFFDILLELPRQHC